MRYTVDVDATRATVTAPPPAVSGYTPDWGKPYGFWKTLGLGVAIYAVTLYVSFLLSSLLQTAMLPILAIQAKQFLSSEPNPELLRDGLPEAISTCVTGVLGTILIGVVVVFGGASRRTFFGAGRLTLRQIAIYVFAIGIWFAVLVGLIAAFTALLFAVTHYRYGAFGVSTIFLFGLLLGVARHRSDTTTLPFLMHATWNLLSLTSWAILTRIV